MIRIAVIEDDEKTVDALRGYLDAYCQENRCFFEINTFSEALSFLDNYTPDLINRQKNYDIVLMDIGLPHLDGMNAAQKLRQADKQAVLIFISSLAKYVRNGYEVDALDFMIKPVSYPEFSLKLKRAVQAVSLNSDAEIIINYQDGILRTRVSDLYYIEVAGHKLYYHLIDQVLETSGTLSRCEKEFAKHSFLRCNNCFLINPKHIEYVKGYKVKVGDAELQISRPRRKPLLLALAKYYA